MAKRRDSETAEYKCVQLVTAQPNEWVFVTNKMRDHEGEPSQWGISTHRVVAYGTCTHPDGTVSNTDFYRTRAFGIVCAHFYEGMRNNRVSHDAYPSSQDAYEAAEEFLELGYEDWHHLGYVEAAENPGYDKDEMSLMHNGGADGL